MSTENACTSDRNRHLWQTTRQPLGSENKELFPRQKMLCDTICVSAADSPRQS
jgi:hypothetical protein